MKSTGVVRKVDALGRIVLPKEIRRSLHIVEKTDFLEIFVENGNIFLKKYDTRSEYGSMIRKFDGLGRIVIPIEIRRTLEIEEEKDALEIFLNKGSIILKPYHPCCIFCNEGQDTLSFKSKNVCKGCVAEIGKLK